MGRKAAITVHRPREAVEELWTSSGHIEEADASVTFRDAPGDRGTEIHVELQRDVPGGRLGGVVATLSGKDPLAKVKDDLRRFKQHVETGEIPRSDGSPEGERVERKRKPHPAQPLDAAELEEVGVR
jgi:uncharacterized membrane protein